MCTSCSHGITSQTIDKGVISAIASIEVLYRSDCIVLYFDATMYYSMETASWNAIVILCYNIWCGMLY